MPSPNVNYSVAQVNEAFNKALNPDATPTQDSNALITSGGVKSAMDGKMPLISYTISGANVPSETDIKNAVSAVATAGITGIVGINFFRSETSTNSAIGIIHVVNGAVASGIVISYYSTTFKKMVLVSGTVTLTDF